MLVCLVLLPIGPVFAGNVGLGINTVTTYAEQNLIYANAKGGTAGSLMLLQSDNALGRWFVNSLSN